MKKCQKIFSSKNLKVLEFVMYNSTDDSTSSHHTKSTTPALPHTPTYTDKKRGEARNPNNHSVHHYYTHQFDDDSTLDRHHKWWYTNGKILKKFWVDCPPAQKKFIERVEDKNSYRYKNFFRSKQCQLYLKAAIIQPFFLGI